MGKIERVKPNAPRPGFISVTERSQIHPAAFHHSPYAGKANIFMDLTTIAKERSFQKEELHKILYARFYGYALKIAFRYLHDYERATTATNSAFADIFKNTDYLKLSGDQQSLKRLIRNRTVINVLKHYDRIVTSSEVNVEADQMISEALSSANSDARLIFCLGRLSPWHCTLYNMHAIDGFSLIEIAQHFRLTESSCALQLQQARTILMNLVTNDTHLK